MPTYQQNKKSIYKWRSNNKEQNNIIKLRYYYKRKIDNKLWADIKYEFLDILRE